jgi:hypothetical protein
MAFDHNAEDPGIALGNLAGNLTTDLNLLFRFFAAVAMTAIDHIRAGMPASAILLAAASIFLNRSWDCDRRAE